MQPVIHISGLTKTYASGHKALKQVDLDIAKGEMLVIGGEAPADPGVPLRMVPVEQTEL